MRPESCETSIAELITPLESAAGSAGAQTLIKNDESDLTVAETLDGVSRS